RVIDSPLVSTASWSRFINVASLPSFNKQTSPLMTKMNALCSDAIVSVNSVLASSLMSRYKGVVKGWTTGPVVPREVLPVMALMLLLFRSSVGMLAG
ncbi:MAG: hypothetical protein ACI9CO_001992, partial [Candidatus Azotimanducaceae bacterium]